MENYLFKCKFIFVLNIALYARHGVFKTGDNFICIGKNLKLGGISLCGMNKHGMVFEHDVSGKCGRSHDYAMVIGADFSMAAKILDRSGVDFMEADIYFRANGKYVIYNDGTEIFASEYTYSEAPVVWADSAMVFAKILAAMVLCEVKGGDVQTWAALEEGSGKSTFFVEGNEDVTAESVEQFLQYNSITEDLLESATGMYFYTPSEINGSIEFDMHGMYSELVSVARVLRWIKGTVIGMGGYSKQSYGIDNPYGKRQAPNDTVH